MKSWILPVVIVAGLIAFFVIFDHKKSNSAKDVVALQEGVTGKKTPAIATMLKPAELVPVVEIKLSEPKPTKTDTIVEEKLTENKPVAVPVVSAEEAEKLNTEAIEFMIAEKEPFYTLYENNRKKTISFEGTINVVSTVPVPSKSDYNDCLYSAFCELESFVSDTPLPKEIIVNVPIMKDKRIISNNILHPGDKVFITAIDYDSMPREIQEIQLSDDIQSFEHQYYFSKTLHKITSFSEGGYTDFSSREISILPIQTLPEDKAAKKSRTERIRKEIVRIEEELKKHGGSFAEWKNEYKINANRYSKLCEEGYHSWIGNSYFAAAGPETSGYNTKQYLSGIIPYKRYLEERNIDLIVVRIPSKWDFAARVLSSESFQENPTWVEHYYECLKSDIEIIDPMYEMWKERFDHPLFYFYQQDNESHPFEGMYLPTAKLLAEVLSRYNVKKTDELSLGDAIFGSNAYHDERRYYPKGNSLFNEDKIPRQLTFKCILLKNERVGRLKTYSGSPFVCISNSYFGITYMQDQGASLPHYLSYYLQHIVDWKYQNGLGNNMLRILLSDRNALNKRKAVIMVGSWGSFKGGFSSIPKYLVENAEKLVLVDTISVDGILSKLNSDSFESKLENGVSMFRAKQEKIRLEIEIPSMPNYKSCMIRLNIPVATTSIRTTVNDSNDKLLDSVSFTIGNSIRADLFIPASENKQKIFIDIYPRDGFNFGIKNIELWGF